MKDRIKKHQLRRGKSGLPFEIPQTYNKNWEQIKNVSDVILIDCLQCLHQITSFRSWGYQFARKMLIVLNLLF